MEKKYTQMWKMYQVHCMYGKVDARTKKMTVEIWEQTCPKNSSSHEKVTTWIAPFC